jgi:DNA-binding transcriptional ArsR family regulator
MTESIEPEHCARMLKALADPERLRIVDCLRRGRRNVTEIANLVNADIANVSHHLGVLRAAGLVLDHKQGRFVVYELHPEIFAATGCIDRLDLGCCKLELPETAEE